MTKSVTIKGYADKVEKFVISNGLTGDVESSERYENNDVTYVLTNNKKVQTVIKAFFKENNEGIYKI